ncbi:hypothetical protein SDC9_74495 [bioreactor metagenome]|uniref:SnoaL-like domain-containing protein n=1 Tax=bioreactor metagenome TaxID=1076179 RepID=A0A644YIZ0_9ZZZZ
MGLKLQKQQKSIGEISKKGELTMKKVGMDLLDKYINGELGEVKKCDTDAHIEIRQVLERFQQGYSERNLEKVDTFVEELFIKGEDTCVLGTATGELFLGSDEVKELIKGDWEYWGNVNINWEDAHISMKNQAAWFSTTGTVSYSFEHTPERYDGYVDFIKNIAEDSKITPKQRVAFINQVLTLTYHQREGKKREYLWPMGLSGVLLKDGGKWKISHLQFSLPKSNFPDERFESSEEFIENYNNQNNKVKEYKNNQITEELKALLRTLEIQLIGQSEVSQEVVKKYFTQYNVPSIIGTENNLHFGVNSISEFFSQQGDLTLSLDLDHAIAQNNKELIWVEATGLLKKNISEDNLAELTLKDLGNLFSSEVESKEKIFAAHKAVACSLREGASGEAYTYPVRLTAVVSKEDENLVFENIHFSFPSYWIFEGKL